MPRRPTWGDNDRVALALTLLAVTIVSLLVHGIASRLGALAPLLLLAVGLAVLVTVLVLRPLWIFPFRALRSLVSARERKILAPRSEGVILSWAGMRGVVTLAAALLLPPETPHRPSLVLIAMVVMIGSLLLQGTTLPALSRALGVRGPDPREDALQEATVIQAAVGAGLRRLEELPDPDEDAVERLQQIGRAHV